MNLNEIEAKCFIMALFIRDDGLRFLLGSGAYEFKDSQLMFAGNTIENDVVSVQGNDGYMLAGQVRRPNTQVFDGYIGDASVSKSEVEGYRRDFMAFFQKNHFYTVVYVMADGSAIQRRRGFLVDAPTSQELWQMYPEYHVALNFEDVNYYKYSENDDGEETYAKSADIGLAKVQYGGLIWDNNSEIEISGTGTNITLAGTMEGGAIESVELNGDTEQTTYSGKNKLTSASHLVSSDNGITVSLQSDGSIKATGTVGSSWNGFNLAFYNTDTIPSGQYTFSIDHSISSAIAVAFRTADNTNLGNITIPAGSTSATGTISGTIGKSSLWVSATTGTSINFTIKAQLESGSSATSFEPYVGGNASPNPDYPQEVQTVTGRQVVTITDGGSQSQEYEVNLGKNLFDLGSNLDNYFVTVGTGTKVYTDNDKTFVTATFSGNKVTFTNYVTTNWRWLSKVVPLEKNTTYTISGDWTSSLRIVGFDSLTSGTIGTLIMQVNPDAGQYPPATFDSGSYNYVVVSLYPGTDSKYFDSIQIEKGSTATTYAPYFTPIELCKIGTYQDYIYKSGEDWYVKKNIGKVDLESLSYITWYNLRRTTDITDMKYVSSNTQIGFAVAEKYIIHEGSGMSAANLYGYMAVDTSLFAVNLGQDGEMPSGLLYYALATPTDIQITNATLISELEDLLSATTYSGTTYITVSGDLASPLEITVTSIGGGGVVWDENGAEWEEGGGGEIVIVNVDSIENILPVWTIRGEAENPTLTNLTTGMSITYNGTVASGQTLVIDLLNKTAKLNGTSVISDVSGQWVEFKPGNNRVSYSTENANAPDSTIEWQEVVG